MVVTTAGVAAAIGKDSSSPHSSAGRNRGNIGGYSGTEVLYDNSHSWIGKRCLMNDSIISDTPHCPHDHEQCVSDALAAAEQVCERSGARLTPVRRGVLGLVWQSHRPMGAYDLLDTLAREDDRRPAPPTVYRALDFLQEHGLVHRIASLNAFIG